VISVVAPVYNEAGSLDELHRRLSATLEPLDDYEIVLVDDGSTDGSWERLVGLAGRDPHLRLLRLSRNFGHQAALSAGLDAARGDAVVLMDADLQDPPEVIPQLVAKWREGYDVVYAVRGEREGEPRLRLASISLFYRLLHRITPTAIPENAGDFRLLSRRAADAIVAMPERARFLRGMTSWIGFRQTGVPYARDARFAGESKYPPSKLVRLALDGITSFSTAPIRLVTGIGFVLVVFCIGVLAWTLYVRFFTSHHPQGWTSLLAVVLLLGGVQLLSLGVIGQYVARIFDETKQRPLYLVDRVVDGGLSAVLPAPQLVLEQREPLREDDVLVGEA
jgi:dolichol-phosphate mannosyltransferase